MTVLSSALQLRERLPDWAWITIIGGLAFVLYRWVRSVPARGGEAVAQAGAAEPPAANAAGGAKAKKAPQTTPPPAEAAAKEPLAELPRLKSDDEDEVEATKLGATASAPLQAVTKKIVCDEDASDDEPTNAGALILVTGMAQTDKGLRRKRNEDSVLALPLHGVYAVADGMGGYRGGEIASALAVKAIQSAFETKQFEGTPHDGIPRRASELARAIQTANTAIMQHSEANKELAGMGTTVCAARFSSNKQQLYIGHVGDSRAYRLRDGAFRQLTSDHTMRDHGVTGAAGAHLSRAVGIWPTVPIDVVLCKPRPKDLYLLCSDGLTKMLTDAQIGEILRSGETPSTLVERLVAAANEHGGKDNISVIVIRVDDASTSDRPPR